jgi:hypothetical protein
MIMVKATAMSEAGARPDPATFAKLLKDMGDFHEELARAGVLLDGAGLRPSRQGWRQRYAADGRTEIVDGPFAETKELLAGYTLIQVRSREEAMEWARRFPSPFPGMDCEIEVRPLYEEADFAPGGELGPL